jgi:hypothetical protein
MILARVDWSGRRETPAGVRIKGRPHSRKGTRRLPDRPRKASACSGNQHTSLTEPIKKEEATL